MKVTFSQECELRSENAFKEYENLIDYHLFFLKQQSKCEFSYWRYAGIFILISMIFFILQDKSIVSTSLIGIGCLLVFTQNMRMDFEYGIKIAACVEEGISIEKKYDYPAKLLKNFSDNKLLSYRSNLLSRLIPMGFVGFATALAGTLLAFKVEAWLGLIIVIFSITILSIGVCFYIKMIRKISCSSSLQFFR